MSKKLICLISIVLVLGLFSNASAELIGHWRFDEGSGDVAFDISGNGNDGTINGAQSVPGVGGSALEFDGVDDYVETPLSDVPKSGTVVAWVNTTISNVRQAVISSHNSEEFRLHLNYRPGTAGATPGFLGVNVLFGTFTAYTDIGSEMYDGSWHHVAFVWEGESPGTIRAYWDGQEKPVTYGDQNAWEGNYNRSAVHVIGREDLNNNNYFFAGHIDDVRFYDHALSDIEVQTAMNSAGGKWPFALGPSPKDGALHGDTWVNLAWGAGGFAVSHDVYLGDNFDDVDNGAGDAFRGNQTTTFYVAGFPGFAFPDGLVPGTTYYWRIDEVNEAEPNSPWKGDIWSFSIPPKTAYAPDPADAAEQVDPDADLSWTGGFGAKLHTVYFGENFDEVSNAAGGLPQGTTTYNPGPLELAKTYYWRVDEFDAIDTYKGEVWSFTIKGAVGSPDPSHGAVDVEHTPTLTWSPGVFAASLEVYFGTDKDAVKHADASSPEYKGGGNLGAESFQPEKLEWNSTYYWRIDEVNNANPDSPWPGPLWSFTIANFLVVDDFEDYDIGNNEIWWTWIDGLGYASHPTLPTHPGNGTGSMVGDETTGSYMEETIVHGGDKSMPVFYDNSILRYSEVEKTLTYPTDWTENGVTTLTIWFRGDSANAAEKLYVVLNGSAVVTHDNPDAAQVTTWTQWTIDLQAFGVNLANVNTIGLGLGDRSNPQAGGSGTMYFDDIRLYPPPPESAP